MREPVRVVFDCVIFTQALINPKGPAGQCLKAAESGDCILHLSPFVLQETRELPGKLPRFWRYRTWRCLQETRELPGKLPVRHGVTPGRVEALIKQVREYAVVVTDVPEQFSLAADPSDAAYVNLALATRSELIVSRDRHLLVLMDPTTPEGGAFKQRFPELRILPPVEFLRELEARRVPG